MIGLGADEAHGNVATAAAAALAVALDNDSRASEVCCCSGDKV